MVSVGSPGDGLRPRTLVVTAIVTYGLLLASGILLRRWGGGTWVLAGLPGREPALSVVAGLGLATVVIWLTRVLLERSECIRWVSVEMRKVLGPVSPGTAAALAFASGIGEEAFFRGAMQPELGFLATSLLFGLLHIGPGRRYFAWTIFAVVMGFLLGALFELTGSLLGPIAAHVCVNYFNLLRIGRLRTDEDGAQASDSPLG